MFRAMLSIALVVSGFGLLSLGCAGSKKQVVEQAPTYPACSTDDHCRAHGTLWCVSGTCKECKADNDCVKKGPCHQCGPDGSCAKIPNCCTSDLDCGSGKRCTKKPGSANSFCK